MEFEWDPAKSDANLASRGFGFEVALLIFLGRTIEADDNRADYGEVRVRAIGMADGVELLVVYTDRKNVRRIISARRANRREREAWHSSV